MTKILCLCRRNINVIKFFSICSHLFTKKHLITISLSNFGQSAAISQIFVLVLLKYKNGSNLEHYPKLCCEGAQIQKKKIDHVKEYISIFATIFSDLVIFLSIYKFLSIIVKMLRKENYCSSLEETIHEKHFTQIISIFSIRRRKS